MEYRYVLRRRWTEGGKTLNFIMLNPSTATDDKDDATIRRCVGFAKRWGFSALVVTNLFALRATNPKVLKSVTLTEAIGDSGWVEKIATESDMVVAAWGDNVGSTGRDREVLKNLNCPIFCIRQTKKGNPAHPVREPYTAVPLHLCNTVGIQ